MSATEYLRSGNEADDGAVKPDARPSTTAERMRRYRKRRRGRMRCARIQLDVTTIDTLIRKGHLEPEARDDQKALELAISDFIWDAVTYGT
jgi:hypothetical protein